MPRILPPLLVALALAGTGCPSLDGIPCGYYQQTSLIIHTTGPGDAPLSADWVTCQVGDDEPRWASCQDEACTAWRCWGMEGRVNILASRSGSLGFEEVLVSQAPCDGGQPEVGVSIGGG